MRTDPSKIDEEVVCIDSLVQRLTTINSDLAISVERVPPGDDPPDYWLCASGQKYAVEIRAITTGQAYQAQCTKLHEDVRARCESSGTLIGRYLMSFMRQPHLPSPRKTGHWNRLVDRCAATILSLATAPAGTETCLIGDSGGYIALHKESDEGAKVYFNATPMPKWEGEVQTELSQLVAAAVRTKRDKIQKKGVLAKCPDVILALYDAYGYADLPAVRQAFANIEGTEFFHSIYWAASFSDTPNTLYPDSPGRAGVFLNSKNQDWR
jgi:hypothetical protein